MSVVSKNIRRIIRAKGYKQGAVAYRAEFNEKQFSAMLNDRKRILADHIPKIAKALDVEICDLFIE